MTSAGRKMLVLFLAVAAGITGAIAASSRSTQTDHSGSHSDEPSKRTLSLRFSNPLGNGDEISAAQAAIAVQRCPDCIGLPLVGSASATNIKDAWSRVGDQAVAIDYVDGLRVYVIPDERSGEEWANDAVAAEGTDLAGTIGFKLVELRNTLGVGIEASGSGPASVAWIEDGLMIEIIGHGGQPLDTLIEIAASFSGVPALPTPSG